MTNNYNTLPPQNIVEKTMEALTEHGFLPEFVPTGKEALKRINQIIPAGASVMNGGSRTLQEIGFTQQLKEKITPGTISTIQFLPRKILRNRRPSENRQLSLITILEAFTPSLKVESFLLPRHPGVKFRI